METLKAAITGLQQTATAAFMSLAEAGQPISQKEILAIRSQLESHCRKVASSAQSAARDERLTASSIDDQVRQIEPGADLRIAVEEFIRKGARA